MIFCFKGKKVSKLQPTNSLHRHTEDMHNGEVQTYKTRILFCEENLLLLCLLEGLYIEKQDQPKGWMRGMKVVGGIIKNDCK